MLNLIFVYFMIYLGRGKENTFIVMGIDMKENLRMIKSKYFLFKIRKKF
jgi:hypothetical protein